jgi:hypothetical protein
MHEQQRGHTATREERIKQCMKTNWGNSNKRGKRQTMYENKRGKRQQERKTAKMYENNKRGKQQQERTTAKMYEQQTGKTTTREEHSKNV